MLKTKKPSKIKYIASIAISGVIIVCMVWKIGIEYLYTTLLKADVYLLLIAFFLGILALVNKLVRWSNLFRETKFVDACKVYLIGQMVNVVAPIGIGELTRAYIAKTKLNIPAGKTLASAIIERVSDTTFLVALSVVCLTLLIPGNGYTWQIAIPILILFVAYTLLFNPHFLDRIAFIVGRLFKKEEGIFNKTGVRFSKSLISFKVAILSFHGKKNIIAQTILLTVLAWIIYASAVFLLLLAFDISVAIFYVLIIVCASEVFGAFSFLPGGLGAKEISLAILLNVVGVPFNIGMAVALIDRGMAYMQLGSGALISTLSFTLRK